MVVAVAVPATTSSPHHLHLSLLHRPKVERPLSLYFAQISASTHSPNQRQSFTFVAFPCAVIRSDALSSLIAHLRVGNGAQTTTLIMFAC